MLSIGVGEIQKNSSVFSNLTETMQIIDKRKKQVLALVYPVRNQSIVQKLAGKYRDKICKTDLSIEDIKNQAIATALREKYDLPS